MREALEQHISSKLISLIKMAEPNRWKSVSDDEIYQTLQIKETIKMVLQHYLHLVDIFGRMYLDVRDKITPSQMDLSFFRSQVTYG